MLVDTNIVSAHFKGDSVVTPKLQAAEVIFLPSIVLGELKFGAHKSPNQARNLAELSNFGPPQWS
jgi:tRNA(fMet)-specific endonuclease VapC